MRKAILLLALWSGAAAAQKGPRYTRIHRLTPREGVFAYARISPDAPRLMWWSMR